MATSRITTRRGPARCGPPTSTATATKTCSSPARVWPRAVGSRSSSGWRTLLRASAPSRNTSSVIWGPPPRPSTTSTSPTSTTTATSTRLSFPTRTPGSTTTKTTARRSRRPRPRPTSRRRCRPGSLHHIRRPCRFRSPPGARRCRPRPCRRASRRRSRPRCRRCRRRPYPPRSRRRRRRRGPPSGAPPAWPSRRSTSWHRGTT
mmetsp:Transcript_9506/g.27889  ORF Transcript_9506/g.27889 Transcript_9506/m.27889 type:complete len:204 (-) Transcript_9506:2762-3373(-)